MHHQDKEDDGIQARSAVTGPGNCVLVSSASVLTAEVDQISCLSIRMKLRAHFVATADDTNTEA